MAKSRDEEGDKRKPKRANRQKLEDNDELPDEGEHVLSTSKVSKRKKKEHSKESQGSRKVKPSFEALHNEQDFHSERSSQGYHSNNQSLSQQGLDDTVHEQADAFDESIKEFEDSTTREKVKMRRDHTVTRNITDFPEKSISNDNKKKKAKKKRDRWGQLLSNVGNTQEDPSMEDDMLENAETDADGHVNGDLKANPGIYEGEYDSKTVCAGGMPYDTNEADILELFEECGAIANVVCMKFADTQRFKGLAFITFKTEAAATKALSLDGVNMGGRHIKIEKARAGEKVLRAPPKREHDSLSVYIGNLNWDIKKIDIKHFFKGCAIDDVRLAVHKQTGNFCGYGHVDFSDEKSLEKAIKLDQNQLLGRPVKISYAVSKGSKGSVVF